MEWVDKIYEFTQKRSELQEQYSTVLKDTMFKLREKLGDSKVKELTPVLGANVYTVCGTQVTFRFEDAIKESMSVGTKFSSLNQNHMSAYVRDTVEKAIGYRPM